ncbi:L-lysine 6-monooxygenase [Nocardiopsis gilva YIM 90087]|uniref:L-lysine N6-monooxygenase MbtG n=1 Tax=Nocardiopsis gilva YIM 90087 TaxID=1235441 RepID=A0A223S7V7_9ACTN|nr:SidA/IucD/PvdA family monooxygenase [Nocardiopsis gilva]ASU84200.1 L-lysine 6-monooxygenase [Nocardiopsis gilva YIM 90087]
MSLAIPDDGVPFYDLIGIGFGPSNLALAIAVTERNEKASDARASERVKSSAPDGRRLEWAGGGASEEPERADSRAGDGLTALFLERQPRFGWHRGMLIDDATMQVSFLKDLVTLRNPTSEFSFLNYLHSADRLVDFINHKNLFPLRVEFHDYLEWAAAKLSDLVSYSSEVLTVRPVTVDGTVEYFDVVAVPADHAAQEREETVYRARNLVFGTGLRPSLPEGVTASERVWHNRDLVPNVEKLAADDTEDPKRFVVVGAGQSAAEATAYLHRRFPTSEVYSVFSRYGYSPSDDSPFANRIFDPAAVDDFYQAPAETKRRIMDYHGNTNYSVVDIELIDDLYRRSYQEKVLGQQRLHMLNLTRVTGIAESAGGVRATLESASTGKVDVLDADIAVFATGYRPASPVGLLGDLARDCLRDDEGRLRVDRDYRVATTPGVNGGLYLQGGTEHTHGITSSLLSNVSIRSADILRSVTERTPAALPRQPEALGATG